MEKGEEEQYGEEEKDEEDEKIGVGEERQWERVGRKNNWSRRIQKVGGEKGALTY